MFSVITFLVGHCAGVEFPEPRWLVVTLFDGNQPPSKKNSIASKVLHIGRLAWLLHFDAELN